MEPPTATDSAFSNPTPASLLERIRVSGDPAAWSRFVQLYTPLLFTWSRRFGLNDHDASDLVQDVLTALVERLREFRYDPSLRFRGWLWTVLTNRVRQSKRRQMTATAVERIAALVVEIDPIDELAEAEYRSYITSRALMLLKADFEPASWKAFQEHVMHGRPAPEVARELGTTAGAVYAAKTRILGRLRAELHDLL